MNNILELNGVFKSYKTFALEDITFALPRGFVMGFIGPNGAGKTTTIKLILNMLQRNAGTIKVFGKDNIFYEQEIKEKIGVVMDNTFYVDEWSLKDIERTLKPFYKRWDSGKYNSFLSDFRLDVNKKVKEISRGMKMKLMIAIALSHEADLLILDEPTSGLDAVARNELMEILSEFIEDENKGVLFSTHVTPDLEKIADYITVINNGRILYSGIKDDLLEKYVIIRGGLDVLDDEFKTKIIGCREHNVGFDGLIDSSVLPLLPKNIITERSNLDEIIVRFNNWRENK
ncbi:MAG: type transport system ATP-binding protein [Kosmotogales bacterium]|nr:type transport system ATP-binding protein [Kosmotogales bacterium]